MNNQLEAACEYMRLNPEAKLTAVARQFEVTRERLRTRIQGGSGKKGPKIPPREFLFPEKKSRQSVNRLALYYKISVRAEFIADVANYILSQRSSKPETAPRVGKSWTTRLIKRHNYHKPHQKTLDSKREDFVSLASSSQDKGLLD